MNYYELGKKDLELVEKLNKEQGRKQRLLIHACCAPCSTFPLEYLKDYFEITLFYTNSNIYPETEYQIRLNELEAYVSKINEMDGYDVKLIVPEYDNVEYTKWLSPRKNQREGQEACFACYKRRLEDTFKYAKEHGYTYVSTVMTISRQKNSQVLNQLGEELEKQYDIKFLHADFKKKGGQDRRDFLSRDMYKQQYCGCVFSYMEYQERIKNV